MIQRRSRIGPATTILFAGPVISVPPLLTRPDARPDGTVSKGVSIIFFRTGGTACTGE